jgi:hypothetical protein
MECEFIQLTKHQITSTIHWNCSLLPNLGRERDRVLATETLDDTARLASAALVSRELKGALPEAATVQSKDIQESESDYREKFAKYRTNTREIGTHWDWVGVMSSPWP